MTFPMRLVVNHDPPRPSRADLELAWREAGVRFLRSAFCGACGGALRSLADDLYAARDVLANEREKSK